MKSAFQWVLLLPLAGSGLLTACGTADFHHHATLDRSQSALIRGDIKLGPFGNATVRLQEVDGHALGPTQRQARLAPGRHSILFSCKAVSTDASNTAQLSFTAKAGWTYDLQLRVLERFPGCSGVLVKAGTHRIVAEPASLKHPPNLSE